MDSVKISVLITCYNRANYIEDAIESVLNSSFNDYELIIVDDNSTDGTQAIISKYENKDSRIRLYYNESNLGQFKNRNYAVSLAKGDYIKFLDSDDILYSHGLDLFYNYAIHNNNVAAIICSDILHDTVPYPIFLNPEQSYIKFYLESSFPTVGPSAILFKRSAFDKVGGFPDQSYVGSDIELLLLLAAKFDILVIHSGLIWYRKHEGQELFKGLQNNEYILNDFQVYLKYIKSLDSPLKANEKKLAINLLLIRNLKVSIKLFLSFKFALGYKLLKNIFSNKINIV
jgi:glycosyltransferase involved in cell wall biosynthesis